MESFKVTLDRIEGSTAVLLLRDNESIKIDFPLFLLPPESKEGDILTLSIVKDSQETEAAKERVSTLLDKLKNKNKNKETD
ncbi:hypothetical protein EO98_07195 [Methanosarcina sp. 2.H.T.1A.6]|uniref:DUF3006 domain-containing protein n=1 Tax=unclassified Methanosarcina TaxID=2644672 RepID=UPI0006217181|nr:MULTISPECIES: DUF3006 domain-containing protein [unclassified Methanosarcina]KKG16119.1 hypothetical protein EO97_17785 [Methanosarcina sp. 2.H.T.1A.15]KKG16417.1 hypothetical protein EO94_07050 [Methanosarcina sp. 2.H.T.1A.3]KKG21512.1 hypothetical protein EO98_07195 [Methanosarcina sp. 2.H.T.1A.6]KKG27416.1 hypothetical protein EO96_04200 [Methanosarcina sp. 2.H.T.1A.8]